MTYTDKIHILENYLNKPEQNYRDSFKTDLYLFFNEDFTEQNSMLTFLKKFDSPEKIENWVDTVTSHIVLKFDDDSEQIGDVVLEFVEMEKSH